MNNETPCPITGGPYEGKPMGTIPDNHLRWLQTRCWMKWKYPLVVNYIDLRLGPIDWSLLDDIQKNIELLFFENFITYPETSQAIEAIIRMGEYKNVLEVGMHTGFTTLHMIRAVYPYGKVTGVDIFDKRQGGPADHCQTDIFYRLGDKGHFRFVEGKTPEILETLKGEVFDVVFVDSDHSLAHTEAERVALWPITRPETLFFFHDCQQHQHQDATTDGDIYSWLYQKVEQGYFKGGIFQTPYRLDTLKAFGDNHRKQLLPHLGVFLRGDV